MPKPIIEVKDIAKRYKIIRAEKYLALRDKITDGLKLPFELLKRKKPVNHLAKEDFWALKGITFDVKQGEAVGIIGRNGAGKTTLLKILSRITYPTKGEINLYGRVASLLEVGTGFHPELSGRENVYFNGSILGMKKAEIDKKFDEIVAFSEVEKFIDTPVKRYSSGMQVRLAFAVAAHLEPEILLVDEVLAVGDFAFQKKCLGKMSDVTKGGRTVLFVSHNMAAIQRLCSRAILLNEGNLVSDGSADKVVNEYLNMGLHQTAEKVWNDIKSAPGNDAVRLHSVRALDKDGKVCSEFDVRDPVTIEINFNVLEKGYKLCAAIEILNTTGQLIMISLDNYVKGDWRNQEPYSTGLFKTRCVIPADFLTEGDISINLTIFSPPARPNVESHVREIDLLRFAVIDKMDSGGVRGSYPYEWGNPALRPLLNWTTERV